MKLKYDQLLSNLAFKCNLRHYTEVLADLSAAAPAGARRVFVEDKMSTLEKVCATTGLEDWELFLVDWGYNTAEERARAVANPRITLLGIDAFVAMLRDAAAV